MNPDMISTASSATPDALARGRDLLATGLHCADCCATTGSHCASCDVGDIGDALQRSQIPGPHGPDPDPKLGVRRRAIQLFQLIRQSHFTSLSSRRHHSSELEPSGAHGSKPDHPLLSCVRLAWKQLHFEHRQRLARLRGSSLSAASFRLFTSSHGPFADGTKLDVS